MPELRLYYDNNGYHYLIMNSDPPITALIGNDSNMGMLCDAMVNDWHTVAEVWEHYIQGPPPEVFYNCTSLAFGERELIPEVEGKILRDILDEVGETLIEALGF